MAILDGFSLAIIAEHEIAALLSLGFTILCLSRSWRAWYDELVKPVILAPIWLYGTVMIVMYLFVGAGAGLVFLNDFDLPAVGGSTGSTVVTGALTGAAKKDWITALSVIYGLLLSGPIVSFLTFRVRNIGLAALVQVLRLGMAVVAAIYSWFTDGIPAGVIFTIYGAGVLYELLCLSGLAYLNRTSLKYSALDGRETRFDD
jgi:tryptophan-rich sensory protein